MNFTEAIFTRKSVRKYMMEALPPDVLENIQTYLKSIQPLFQEIGTGFYIHDNLCSNIKMKGMFLVDAPYYLMFSSELREDYLLNAGFIMQQALLYLHAKGIASCYQGGFRPNPYIRSKLKQEYVIAAAFGKAKGELCRQPEKAKRLSREQVVVWKEEASGEIMKLISAGIAAPSSMNNQPWRMVAYQNRIHIFCKKGHFKKAVISDAKLIDMGIMLANMVVAADEEWMNVEISQLQQMKERQFRNVAYIASLQLKEEVL